MQSASKFTSLRPTYQPLTKEELNSFWGRGFYIYLLPLLKVGNSKVFEVDDLPEVDAQLQGTDAGEDLSQGFAAKTLSRSTWDNESNTTVCGPIVDPICQK